jgi:ribosomal protein S1
VAGEADAVADAAEAETPGSAEATPDGATSDGGAAPDEDGKPRRGRPRLQLDDVEVGTQMKGKVVGLAKFGAFVDIGAVTDGLVHISELSAKRVNRVEDVVKQGDAVEVWVKEVDVDGNRISLSMRRKPRHPMDALLRGQLVDGTVTSLTKYGAFVDIGSETEGLVHVSEMSSGFVDNPKDVVKVGDTIQVRIKDIDQARKRISLSMAGLVADTGAQEAEPEASAEPEERMPTVVELALRKAMGEMQEAAEEDGAQVVEAPADEGLASVYARMLQEYHAQKDEG